MAEGKIILYDWEREQKYPPGFRSPDSSVVIGPVLGDHWSYFPAGATDCIGTEGKLTHIDWDSGVIMTDAGEILIRGG